MNLFWKALSLNNSTQILRLLFLSKRNHFENWKRPNFRMDAPGFVSGCWLNVFLWCVWKPLKAAGLMKTFKTLIHLAGCNGNCCILKNRLFIKIYINFIVTYKSAKRKGENPQYGFPTWVKEDNNKFLDTRKLFEISIFGPGVLLLDRRKGARWFG